MPPRSQVGRVTSLNVPYLDSRTSMLTQHPSYHQNKLFSSLKTLRELPGNTLYHKGLESSSRWPHASWESAWILCSLLLSATRIWGTMRNLRFMFDLKWSITSYPQISSITCIMPKSIGYWRLYPCLVPQYPEAARPKNQRREGKERRRVLLHELWRWGEFVYYKTHNVCHLFGLFHQSLSRITYKPDFKHSSYITVRVLFDLQQKSI